MTPHKVLLAGLPRSGTTWIARAIELAPRARVVLEPDNEDRYAYAIKAKDGLGRYPCVEPGAGGPAALERLWEGAFSGGARGTRDLAGSLAHRAARKFPRRSSVHRAQRWSRPRVALLRASVALATPLEETSVEHVVVKSVFSALSLGWICARWRPRLVVVSKNALNTVASWRRLGWDRPFHGHPTLTEAHEAFERTLAALAPEYELPPAPPVKQTLARLTWELCTLRAATLSVQATEPTALGVRHEDLCADPQKGLRDLFDDLGLEWNGQVARFIERSNAAGGNPYDTRRVAREEAERWRDRLSADEARTVRSVVDGFRFDW